MADVFVSYAHQDREWVIRFAEALHKRTGWEIWWDHEILPGEQFDDVIQNAMAGAKSAVVVWSSHSVASRWVKTEAREAATRNILVPVMIAQVELPLEFRSFETANLTGWAGDNDHPNFNEVAEALRRLLAGERPPSNAPGAFAAPQRPASSPAKKKISYLVGGLVAAATAVAVIISVANRRDGNGSQPPTTTQASIVLPASTESRARPNLTFGVWTLRKAIDDEGKSWNNSAIKFTTQKETPDGLALEGTFTWRLNDAIIGTEEFTGYYDEKNRQVFLEGTKLHVIDAQVAPLALGSYSAVISPDGRELLDGRWGQSRTAEAGVPGRWEAAR